MQGGPHVFTGEHNGQEFQFEMDGLECPVCGYQIIEGSQMPELMRRMEAASEHKAP
jgi:DNA-directed RNA polymerase subunit RPC12/RpoP